MKKPASKVAKPAQIQPKSQFLFHKNLPPRDFSIMTLSATVVSKKEVMLKMILYSLEKIWKLTSSICSRAASILSWADLMSYFLQLYNDDNSVHTGRKIQKELTLFICSRAASILSWADLMSFLSVWWLGVTLYNRLSNKGYLVTRWTGT